MHVLIERISCNVASPEIHFLKHFFPVRVQFLIFNDFVLQMGTELVQKLQGLLSATRLNPSHRVPRMCHFPLESQLQPASLLAKLSGFPARNVGR